MAQLVQNLPAMQETWVQLLGWEDPPGEGKGYPLHYSGLENSVDSVVHGVAKSEDTTEGLSLPLLVLICSSFRKKLFLKKLGIILN